MPLSRIAAIAVASTLVVGPAPAVAAPGCETPTGYAAGAGAELLALTALDLRPLGLPVGPVADLRIGSSRSAMDTLAGPVKAAAAARYLDAEVLGIDLPGGGQLSKSAYQQAPPHNAKAVTVPANRLNLGVASAGTGNLSAYATWNSGLACGTKPAEATRTNATVAGADVLAGPGGVALVRIPAALRTRTATGLHAGGSPVASASAGLAEARLFAGTPAEIKVKVIRSAELTVGADVTYRAPIVEVSAPGIGKHRLDAPGQVLDVPLDGLGGLLGVLRPERLRGVTGRGEAGPLGLPILPTTPLLEAGGLPAVGQGGSLLRVTVGTVKKDVSEESVRAEATTVRLQVATRPQDDRESSSVVDLHLGRLDAQVLAPRRPAPPTTPPATPPAGAAGGLPVTGANVGWVAAAGALLVVIGGSLLMAGRRRRGSVRPIHDRTYG
ncbi:LPXTG cell wall anchor domain-containing protein [Phytohabitans kaempferiae]|uniref:LPXTG cell wall anchor domain-containing protein n=1 Tax=Phytohabitans kaempferiae TaxID=1620943 RepID=A0ABV6LWV1_9ACTN